MLRSIAAFVAAIGIASTFATVKPAEAGEAAGCAPHYGYPADYYGLPTYHYGGFYGPRFVFAPCVFRVPYGYFARYRTVRRYW